MYGGTERSDEPCHEVEDNFIIALGSTDCSVVNYCLNIPTITNQHPTSARLVENHTRSTRSQYQRLQEV